MKTFITFLLLLLIGAASYYFLIYQDEMPLRQPATSEDVKKLDLPVVEESPPILYPVPEVYTDNAPEVKIDDVADMAIPMEPPAPEPEPEPEPYVEPKPEEKPLPKLESSDGVVKRALSLLVNPQYFEQLFFLDSIIHRFVVTVDNLPNPKLPNKVRLTRPPSSKFIVQKYSDGSLYIDPKNTRRYDLFAQLLEAIDTDRFVDLYIRYYPLLQEAYDSLGYKNRYFNDRLVDVIDHLLDAPEINGPIRLVQPNVFYLYADPELERLSSGQKIMLRIGNGNAILAKGKLRELRKSLTRLNINN